MSPLSQFTVLALASAALAIPNAGHARGHAHVHRHLHAGSGPPYAYSAANSTATAHGPTGTGKAPSYGSQSAPSYATETNSNTVTSTLFKTVYETVKSSSATSDVQVGAASASGQCDADVTVTNTEKVYVTVTAGGASSSAAPAPIPYGSSSSVASPVQSSSSVASIPAYTPPDYSAPSSSSSEAAPVSTFSSASAPAYSASAYTPSSESSSVAAPVSSAPAYTPPTESTSSSSAAAVLPSVYSSVAKEGSGASTTASAPASYSSAASSSGGKRGLAYNDVSLTECFSGSSMVSWAYNWISSSGGLTGYNYIPTLHGDISDFTGSWSSDAQKAIDSGSTTLFSFNEPDISSQSNLGVSDAVAAHKQYMGPFDGKAKVCAPSVSNSGSTNQGLDYLKQFLAQCTGSDCPVDCLNVHWYSPCDSESFITYIKSAVDMLTGNQTLYVSEFGVTTGSDSDIDSFLQDVMKYMDGESKIAGYAYFMVDEGKLVNNNEPSTYGSTYKSFSS